MRRGEVCTPALRKRNAQNADLRNGLFGAPEDSAINGVNKDHQGRGDRLACYRQRMSWQLLIILCLAVLPRAHMQQCLADDFPWPREQCSLKCPKAANVRCGYRTTYSVEVDGTRYCCMCVADGPNQFRVVLCPGSASPRPEPPSQIAMNATIDSRTTSASVIVTPSSATLTSYIHISPDLKPKDPFIYNDVFSYLEVSVEAVEVNVSNTTASAVVRHFGPGKYERDAPNHPRAHDLKPSEPLGADSLRSGSVVGAESGAGMSFESSGAALYACKGLAGGVAHDFWTDEPVRGLAHSPEEDVAQSVELEARRAASAAGGSGVRRLEWYLLDGEPPQVSVGSIPFYLHQGADAGYVPIMKPWPKGSKAATKGYVMGLRGLGVAYRATVKAENRNAIELKSGVWTEVRIDAEQRAFLYCRAPKQEQEVVVALDIVVQDITNASVRVYTALDMLGTTSEWMKWVGGSDYEIHNMPDRFFTALEIMRYPQFGSWTIETTKKTVWRMSPQFVEADMLRPDVQRMFDIPQDKGLAFFKLKPGFNDSRLFFQLMPSSKSRAAYARWEDLQQATRIMASTRVNGEWAYYHLSDWGYTTDGTPGLQVMISQWDDGASLYLYVYLRRSAPSNSFTVVCYQVDDTLSAWKWWFGGIFFALIIFCMARCMLCRTRHGQSLLGRRMGWGQRNGNGIASMHGGFEMQEVPRQEFATTTEQPPARLLKVGDTLYSRHTSAGQKRIAEVQASVPVIGPMLAGVENMELENDVSCSICMDREPDTVLLECGHGGVCTPCAQSIWNTTPEGRLCPMCRKQITGVVKIVGDLKVESGAEVAVEVLHYSYAPPVTPGPSLLRRWMGSSRNNSNTNSEAPGAHALPTGGGEHGSELVEVRNVELSNIQTQRPFREPVSPQPAALNGVSGGVAVP